MKRYLDYLSTIGGLSILTAFVWVYIAEGSLRAYYYLPSRYFLIIGILLEIPFSCYKILHWEEYKSENRVNVIILHILFALLLLFLLFVPLFK